MVKWQETESPCLSWIYFFLESYLCYPSYAAQEKQSKRRLTPAHLGTGWEGSSATWQHPPSLPRPEDTPGEEEQFPCQLLCNYSSKSSAASEANKHWANQQETPLHQPLALGREELKHSACESRERGLEDTQRLSNNKTRQSGLCY